MLTLRIRKIIPITNSIIIFGYSKMSMVLNPLIMSSFANTGPMPKAIEAKTMQIIPINKFSLPLILPENPSID